MDTVKIALDTILPGFPKVYEMPIKATNYMFFIRQDDFIYNTIKEFSTHFSKTPNNEVHYSSGINLSDSKPEFDIIEIIDVSAKTKFNSITKSYVKLIDSPQLLKTNLSNGTIKYSANKDLYFVVDPKGNPQINPGIFASFINGSIIEIKTTHHHYSLYMTKIVSKSVKDKRLDEVIQLRNKHSVETSVYPFLSDDKPTQVLKGGKFVPATKND